MAYLIINHANGLQWGQKVATIWKIFLSKIVQDFRHRILENMLWNLYENVHVKFFWPQSVEIFFVLFFRVRSKPPPQIPHDQDSTQIVEYFVYIVLLLRAHMGIFLASNVIYRSQHISPWYLVIWQFVRDQFAQGKKHKAKDVVKVFLVEMLTYV